VIIIDRPEKNLVRIMEKISGFNISISSFEARSIFIELIDKSREEF